MKTVSPASGILLGGFLAGSCDFITPSVQFVMKGGKWYQPGKGVASGIFGSAAAAGTAPPAASAPAAIVRPDSAHQTAVMILTATAG
jgi:hypothetical protein